MKAKERHELKQNEFAATAMRVATALRQNRSRIVTVATAAVLVLVAVGAFVTWRGSRADRAGAALGAAIATAQAPIAPASTLPGAAQAAGTYPTEKARSEAALRAFQEVAAAYPSTVSGLAAEYEAAGELVDLGRLAEAETQYNKVIAANSPLYSPMARLGLAQTKMAAGRYHDAMKLFTDLSGDRDGALPVDGVLMQLAQACEKAGQTADARAAYRRIVDEFSDSVYASAARQELASLN
jgi:TolA-binding protein